MHCTPAKDSSWELRIYEWQRYTHFLEDCMALAEMQMMSYLQSAAWCMPRGCSGEVLCCASSCLLRSRSFRSGMTCAKGMLRCSPVLRQAHEEGEGFNPGWLEDENERVLVELPGSCVTPLCSQPGCVALTAARIYFQPYNISSNSPVEIYQLTKACSMLALSDIGHLSLYPPLC